MTTRRVCSLALGGIVAMLVAAAPATQPAKPGKPAPPSLANKASSGPQQFTCRVIGLFSPDREADLRAAVDKLAVALVSLDVDRGEATFSYDPAVAFPTTKPENVLQRFDQELRTSDRTFSARPVSTTPRDKLTRVEIPAGWLDCKPCCLAVYEMLMKVDGVEHATASVTEGRVTALVDPSKADREKLEAALKKGGVAVGTP